MADAGVVALGEPLGFPVPLNSSMPWAPPDVATRGFSAMGFNNLWQPYRKLGRDVPAEANYAFRFALSWGSE